MNEDARDKVILYLLDEIKSLRFQIQNMAATVYDPVFAKKGDKQVPVNLPPRYGKAPERVLGAGKEL